MFILHANKNQLTVRQREPLTSGSVNVCQVSFRFSEDWEGLTRTAVFRAGNKTRSVILDGSGTADIPWEVLTEPKLWLYCGVCGTRGDDLVLPTIWAQLGYIQAGAVPGQESRPPTPDIWEQKLDRKGDALSYDGLNLSLMSGGKPLSTVKVVGGGGEGGTTDHRVLSNRDAAEQHPIESISGLRAELDRIPEPVEALTNSELEEMLK